MTHPKKTPVAGSELRSAIVVSANNETLFVLRDNRVHRTLLADRDAVFTTAREITDALRAGTHRISRESADVLNVLLADDD